MGHEWQATQRRYIHLFDKQRTDEVATSWSPDGKRLTFLSDSARGQIYIMDADGSNRRVLVSRGVPAAPPGSRCTSGLETAQPSPLLVPLCPQACW